MENETANTVQEETVPKLRTPLETYLLAAASIIGLLAMTAGMLYAWTQVL